MHDPTGSSSNTLHTAAASRTTETRRSPIRRRMGGADISGTLCGARKGLESAYGHNWRTARRCARSVTEFFPRVHRRAHLLGEPHRFLDQRLHDLGFGDRLDHFAADEDLALAITRRDAVVGLARLPGTVDDTTHYGHPQRHVQALQAGADLVRQGVDVHLGATTRRTRHDLEPAGPQVQRFED